MDGRITEEELEWPRNSVVITTHRGDKSKGK